MTLTAILFLVGVHWLADFVFQNDDMALKKSRSIKWLAFHVLVYSSFYAILGWQFVLITYACHFVTDFVSSRLTARLVHLPSKHWFFVVIGADQALHMAQLFLTYNWLYA